MTATIRARRFPRREGAARLPMTHGMCSVESGDIAAVDPTHRESVAGPPPRFRSAAAAIEALTFPAPFNLGGVKR